MIRWQTAPCQREQLVLFPSCLEDRIPADHPVRLLDEILQLMDWSEYENQYHGRLGQPAIHPSILCKVILYGMIRRIRSSRQLEYAVSHHIDFIWLVEGRAIDHTTISKFRTAHAKQLRELYRSLCQRAVHLGVAKLAEVCIDGSRVLGNANRYDTLTAEKTEKLLSELDRQVQAALEELQRNDEVDEVLGEDCGDTLPPEIADLKARQQRLQELHHQLQEMDVARRKDGIDPQKNPAQLSPTDPDARIMPNKTGGYAPNYTPLVVTETTHGFILGADVVMGNVEHTVAVSMIDTLEADYGQRPETVMGDAAFSTGPNLAAWEDRSIELLSPMRDQEPTGDNPAVRPDPSQPVAEDGLDKLPLDKQTKKFSRQAFVYDEDKDVYYCPAGKELPLSYTEQTIVQGQTAQRKTYQAKTSTCQGCPLADRCRTKLDAKGGRRVRHDQYESHRQRHREKMKTADAQKRYQTRLHFGETQFGVIKQWMGLRQFLLRGIDKVTQEWLWHCTAYNLQKLIKLWGPLCALQNENLAGEKG